MAEQVVTTLGTAFERIVMVLVYSGPRPEALAEGEQPELARLIHTLGGTIVATLEQRVDKPHHQSYVRPGKYTQILQLCDVNEADTVVFDCALTPTQIAHLEQGNEIHFMDRRELILEIFARRAQTAEAKIQVELAYLDFFHPRMERSVKGRREHRGGLRGAGANVVQQRLEVARKRRAALRKRLDKIKKQHTTRVRSRSGMPTVALVGYTNAGKSSLLNAFAGNSAYADDLLFATLDTTTRRVYLPSERIALVSDTVGFIRDLPHELVACFHTTLEEAVSAQVLVHVVDATSRDLHEQIQLVEETLGELGADHQPRILALNKTDALSGDDATDVPLSLPGAIPISAHTGAGLDQLKQAVDDALAEVNEPACTS